MKNNLNHNTAPLPFQGQKRNFVKEFKTVLKQYDDQAIYVDLFGGSGLLSHTAKQIKPDSRVIYNDYDHFTNRLEAIPVTNQVLAELRELFKDLAPKTKISKQYKIQALNIIKNHQYNGYVDYVTLSSSLLFSMKYANSYEELAKETFYNKIRKSEYNAGNYLDGVEIVHQDYKTIFNKFKDNKNVVFLVDPPYLSTDCSTYKNYWRLSDYLDVLKVLINTKYFYFTSDKSSIIELCEWIENNTGGINPFKNAKVKYHYNSTSYNSGYNDVMLYKGWNTSTTLK